MHLLPRKLVSLTTKTQSRAFAAGLLVLCPVLLGPEGSSGSARGQGRNPAQQNSQQSSQQSPERGSIRVEVSLVNVLASVLDKNNRPAADLLRDQFEIYEEGKPAS